MKLLSLVLLSQTVAQLNAKPLDSKADFTYDAELDKRVRIPGLQAPVRQCAGLFGAVFFMTVCSQGASGALEKTTKSCQGSTAYACFLDWMTTVGYHILGVAGVGAGTAYAFGYNFGVGVIQEATRVGLTGASRLEGNSSNMVQPGSGFARILPPLKTNLPKLTAAHVAKNLSYPFVFEQNGWMNTYFPEGHETDPTMLYHHVLAGNNDTKIPDIVGQRYKDLASLGLAKVAVANSVESSTCKGTQNVAPFKIVMNSGYGIYLETVATCGHPSHPGDSEGTDDIVKYYMDIPNYGVSSDKMVMEAEIYNRFNGYTFENVRLVGETRAGYTSCFEGQHRDAYCKG